MELVLEESPLGWNGGSQATKDIGAGASPPLSAPNTPGSTPGRAAMPTPLVVRSNLNRRCVSVGEEGATPKETRVVELTPLAERKQQDFAPGPMRDGEEELDFGPPVVRPSQQSGAGGGAGGRKNKKKKKKKKKNLNRVKGVSGCSGGGGGGN